MKKLNINQIKIYLNDINCKSELLSNEYVNAKTKLEFRCECGKLFKRTYESIKRSKKAKCASCSHKGKIMSKESKIKTSKARMKPIEEVLKVVEGKMKCKYIDRYIKPGTRSTIIKFECKKHGIQEAYWTNLVKRKSCPYCQKSFRGDSKMVRKLEQWFADNNIYYEKEKKFEGCKDKRELPFDFYIPSNNILIEIDGEHHFRPMGVWKNKNEIRSSSNFEYTQYHDKLKNSFCKDNNIKLIRIPYYKESEMFKIIREAI
ncbi:hypothetical protein P3F01_15495 [Clostridium perfringens]|uniref:hypothetical protein n=1 Tax=Clostridium perfringens TaxID=1502 RepID=UPI0028E0C5BE|nr:hypothetical protein [Clostridium perfringens]MDT9337763.1 hypothetical protein [Clostridium perfringens]MDT9345520.1 hypothetical protein [Clostridium perfringens]MDT9348763.1 hypothetical protein [Clostridium perfringens]MDT9354635.1 hypothetical protein [Clostridium perfringens]